MSKKRRLSASVDSTLFEAAERAVSRGRADSLSAWVNDALALKVERDRALEALADFIDEYEAEHGEITAEEIRNARRRAASRGVGVRALTASEKTRRYASGDDP